MKTVLMASSVSTPKEEELSIKRVDKVISEDLWCNIFLHLPLTSIFKSRCVSKVWLSMLSNPHFINQWYKDKQKTLPWTLVYDVGDTAIFEDEPVERKFMIAYPECHSEFISHHRNGFSFNFCLDLNAQLPSQIAKPQLGSFNFGFSENERVSSIFITAASKGLILCRLGFSCEPTTYVYNPLTRKSISIPAPPPTKDSYAGTGLICYESCSSPFISTSIKVILIPETQTAGTFEVSIFTSDSGEWNTYKVPCPLQARRNGRSRNVVTHNGVFYWCETQSKMVVYNLNNNNNNNNETCGYQCKLISLPDNEVEIGELDENFFTSHRLGESEGLICYARIKKEERTLSVWVLQEEEKWYLLHKEIKFPDVIAESAPWWSGACIQVIGFHPVDHNVVLLGYKKYVWAYNARTRGCEQLCHPSFLPSCRPTLHSGWISLAVLLMPMPTVLSPVSWLVHSPPKQDLSSRLERYNFIGLGGPIRRR